MVIFLDTETTGLGEDAEIVEITMIDDAGEILMNTLIKPTKPIPPETTKIHGITNEMVQHAPRWEDVASVVYYLVTEHGAYAYNAQFDVRMINQSSQFAGYQLTERQKSDSAKSKVNCAMEKAVEHLNISYPHYSLVNAAADMGITFDGLTPHQAASDCAVTLDLVRKTLGINRTIATGDCAQAFNEHVREFNKNQIFLGR